MSKRLSPPRDERSLRGSAIDAHGLRFHCAHHRNNILPRGSRTEPDARGRASTNKPESRRHGFLMKEVPLEKIDGDWERWSTEPEMPWYSVPRFHSRRKSLLVRPMMPARSNQGEVH
jgi:hypothetical protein